MANVIIGARNEEQLRQNLGAVGWNLTPAQVAKLLRPTWLWRASKAAGLLRPLLFRYVLPRLLR